MTTVLMTFNLAKSFNRDLGDWDVSSVTSLSFLYTIKSAVSCRNHIFFPLGI